MNNLNSVILEGNLAKDPVMIKTPHGTPVCRFTVASNRYYKTQGERREEVGFFDVETWSGLAENCAEYLHQGRGVRVVGRLKQDRWKNEDGDTRSRIQIVGEHVEFRAYNKPQNQSDTASEAAEIPAEDILQPDLTEKKGRSGSRNSSRKKSHSEKNSVIPAPVF